MLCIGSNAKPLVTGLAIGGQLPVLMQGCENPTRYARFGRLYERPVLAARRPAGSRSRKQQSRPRHLRGLNELSTSMR